MRYIIFALLSFPTTSAFANNDKMIAAQLTASSYPVAHVHHIVLFKFKPEVTEAQKQQVVERFRALVNPNAIISIILKASLVVCRTVIKARGMIIKWVLSLLLLLQATAIIM